jgi:hypothetical protein
MEIVTKYLNNIQLPPQLEGLLKDESNKKIVVYGATGTYLFAAVNAIIFTCRNLQVFLLL